jgi:ERF superfamily protein
MSVDPLFMSVPQAPEALESAETEEIYKAFIAAQGEFTPVEKKKIASVYNPKSGKTYTYQYADIGDVLKMVTPILSKHGIAILQPHILFGNQLRVCTRLVHTSGQWMMSYGIDLSTSGSPQDFGGDSSYFRRYDMSSFLGIASEDDNDAAGNSQARGAKPPVRSPQPVSQPSRSAPPSQAREEHQEPPATEVQPDPDEMTDVDKEKEARAEAISKLRALIPDAKELARRAKKQFPQHASHTQLSLADVELLVAIITKEKQDPANNAMPADLPADMASMFDEGRLTTANKVDSATIGKGLAQKLHILIGVHKVHTEKELEDVYLKPLGISHASDLPRHLYETICQWAEGKLVEGAREEPKQRMRDPG